MHHVYVLKSRDHWRFYVGISQNVPRRLIEHNRGHTKSTKGYAPWVLFFTEAYSSRTEARKREVFLKSGSGKELIKNRWLHQNDPSA